MPGNSVKSGNPKLDAMLPGRIARFRAEADEIKRDQQPRRQLFGPRCIKLPSGALTSCRTCQTTTRETLIIPNIGDTVARFFRDSTRLLCRATSISSMTWSRCPKTTRERGVTGPLAENNEQLRKTLNTWSNINAQSSVPNGQATVPHLAPRELLHYFRRRERSSDGQGVREASRTAEIRLV